MAAWAVLWFANTRDGYDWKAPITASKWRHLEEYLWPEIHKWSRRLRWDRVGRPPYVRGRDLLELSLNLRTGSAFAVASNEPANIEGAHADHLLYIYDEAKTIPDETWDASEGAFSGAGEDTDREAYALAFSTPGEPAGRFYAIHSRQAGYEDWRTRHVTLADAITAGRVSRAWAESRAAQWGASSAVFKNRVLGEFAASETDALIPLEWVELAVERWRFWERQGEQERPGFTCVAADVADGGEDETVLALRYGDVIGELRRPGPSDTMTTTGHVAAVLRARPGGYAVVDSIGVGAGVVARLRELASAPLGSEESAGLIGLEVVGFNAAEATRSSDVSGELAFANKRAAAWWGLRDRLNPAHDGRVALPDDPLLIGDLCAPKWQLSSAGKVLIESKDEIRRRLGRSTDTGDAVVMAFWEEESRARTVTIIA
jgi:hypothetical protein